MIGAIGRKRVVSRFGNVKLHGLRTIGNPFEDYMRTLLSGANVFWLPLTESSGSFAVNAAYGRQLGSELLTNGNLESWASATDANSWTETLAGTSTINRESTAPYAGSYAARYDVDGSNSTCSLVQGVSVTAGDTYRLSMIAKSNPTGQTMRLDLGASVGGGQTLTTAYAQYTRDVIGDATGTRNSSFNRLSAAGASLYVDSLSVKKVGQLDGQYNGPTLAGDTLLGQNAPTFDGLNDNVLGEFNRLETIFKPETPTAGSRGLAIKLSQAIWENATTYVFWSMGVNATNVFKLHKPAATTLRFSHILGGTAVDIDYAVTSADYGKYIFPMAVWNASGVSLFVKTSTANGSYSGGTWSASALTQAYTQTMSMNSANYAPGTAGQSLYVNKKLTQAEYDMLYTLFKAQEPNAA